jgi:peptide/nickel transport system substrate-binding protein
MATPPDKPELLTALGDNGQSAQEAPVRSLSLTSRAKKIRRNFNRLSRSALRHAQKFLVSRWDNLRAARREMVAWLMLATVLIAIGVAQTMLQARLLEVQAPTNGGTYAEGVVDKIATINPLFASTDSEKAASQLVYASLLTYDTTNHLMGNLANRWSVSEDGKSWTVRLKPSVHWSDGQPITPDDVEFTVNLIKNQAVGSPLYSSWRTIDVKVIDAQEIQFSLDNVYMSFPFALTFGIVPKHILEDIEPSQLKNFTTIIKADGTSVASGAFRFRSQDNLPDGQTIWRFWPNDKYWSNQPQVSGLTIRTYHDNQALLDGLNRDEINAAAGLDVKSAAKLTDSNQKLSQAPLADGVFALFNNSGPLTASQEIREALRLGTDRTALRQAMVENSTLKVPEPLETPLLPGLDEAIDALTQPNFDQQAANDKLEAAGWTMNQQHQRQKSGQKLSLSVVTIKGADYEIVARQLVKQWQELGVDAILTAAEPSTVQQNYLMPRAYDVLIYQLHLGVDWDELAYWTSSQTVATGLNFANYKSKRADIALTAGRSQLNQKSRQARYQEFVKQWLNDAPAIALYVPNYYYVNGQSLQTLDSQPLVDAASRFREVSNWTVRTAIVYDSH